MNNHSGSLKNSVKSKLTLEDKQALNLFVQNFYWGESLSQAVARKNTTDGLIEIEDDYNRHRANGMLITENGFFITNHHCYLHSEFMSSHVRDSNQQCFPMEYACAISRPNDLVLVKAGIKTNAAAKCYEFYNQKTSGLSSSLPIVLLTRRRGELIVNGGYTNGQIDSAIFNSKDVYKNQFCLDLFAKLGDSGGIITTIDDRMIGLLTGGDIDVNYNLCTSWYAILNLIIFSINRK